jgi:hypothetical protein
MELLVVLIIVGITAAFVGYHIYRTIRPPNVQRDEHSQVCNACCRFSCDSHEKSGHGKRKSV